MVNEFVGDIVPAPRYSELGSFTTDQELLVSTQGGFTQKGVTLKAGQGELQLGTILAKETASRLYVKYDNTASNGAEVPVGVLRTSVNTGTDSAGDRHQANVVLTGILNLALVTAANTSAVLAAGTTALGARKIAAQNAFKF